MASWPSFFLSEGSKFSTAAHMRPDHHAGRRSGKSRKEPNLSNNLTRSHAAMIKEKGGVNSEVSVEFLKRLITGANRPTILIVDRGPAHIAKKTKAFVESLNGKLRLFYLPPYSPDRNPDELVWKRLKDGTVCRMAITDKADFKTKVHSSMRQLQNNPEKIRSSWQKPSLKYASQWRLLDHALDLVLSSHSSKTSAATKP